MHFFQNLPIKRKLLLVTVTTCSTALALACTALFWFQSVNFRKGFAAELQSLGAVIAHNSIAPLTFQDKKAALEVLAALKVKPHITYACIVDSNGDLFAQFGENGEPVDVSSVSREVVFAGGYADLSVPIDDDAIRLGVLYVRGRFADQYRELLSLYGGVLAAVVVGSLLIIILMSSLMQRVIAGPITDLAGVARAIAERDDYTVRAPAKGKDEVGLLTQTFNQMLDQIETRESALEEARLELARQLDALHERNLILENAVEGIAVLDDQQRYVSVNRAYAEMIGSSPKELVGCAHSETVHPADRSRATTAFLQMQREGKVTLELRAVRRDGSIFHKEVTMISHRGPSGEFLGHYRFMKDITPRKEAEAELARLNRELQQSARQTGMTEVATGVLHNVGNVLNSVNVSATLVIDRLRKSESSSLSLAVDLIQKNKDHLDRFFVEDVKGRQLPVFLAALAGHLAKDENTLLQEMQDLQQNIDHIKQIVAMQQAYAKVSGVLEKVSAQELMEAAVRMTAPGLVLHQVEVVREYVDIPHVMTDSHKILQILINLLNNAKQALDQRPDNRRLILRIAPAGKDRVKIEVEDNGIGITAENLARVFSHGFTTKKSGHGFGLHSGANAAQELGGRLTARSNSVGRGATFALELPTTASLHNFQAA